MGNWLLAIPFAIAAFFAFSMFMRFMLARQRRNVLLNLRRELNKMRWLGEDEGWNSAIEAVRAHIVEIADGRAKHAK